MARITNKKNKFDSNDMKLEQSKEKTFEQRKREAYSAMGKLGGLARAKQMAEKGFMRVDKIKSSYESPINDTKKNNKENTRKK